MLHYISDNPLFGIFTDFTPIGDITVDLYHHNMMKQLSQQTTIAKHYTAYCGAYLGGNKCFSGCFDGLNQVKVVFDGNEKTTLK